MFLHSEASLVLAKGWFWLGWLNGHSIAGVSDLQPLNGDQLVPLANLLTVVLVSFLVVFWQVVMMSNPPSYALLTMRSWEVPRNTDCCWLTGNRPDQLYGSAMLLESWVWRMLSLVFNRDI